MGLFDSWNVKDFRIVLASSSVIPGGAVSGNLTFTVTKAMSFRGVTIKVLGKECTHISVQRSHGTGKNRRTTTHHYYGRTNVYKQHLTILGGLKGSNFKGDLPPGEYNFPFAFVIPPNAPPSIPKCGHHNQSGNLSWYVKAEIDIPFSFSDSNAIAPFVVATAMPISQYQTRQPFLSPVHRARRSCCCCDQGTTTIQMNLAQNMLVFGRDQAMEGNISINNQESKADTNSVNISIRRVCWINAAALERTPAEVISQTTINSQMKAGDAEKRFNFSIPLPNDPKLVSCYRGHKMFYYYQLIAVSSGDVLFTVNLIASNALDESNRCMPIDVNMPGPIVLPRQYPQFVYAPPPGGQPNFPQQPPGFFPQPTGAVRALQYQAPGQAPPPPTFMSQMGPDMSIYAPTLIMESDTV